VSFFVVAAPEQLATLMAYLEAKREAAHWDDVCTRWTRLCGFSVWREGHPLDLEKLRQRRLWRQRAKALGRELGLSP
jgi:hypothetical protein